MRHWRHLLILLAACCMPFAVVAQERMRGVAVSEERLALVIGNAAYVRDPLDNPVNDARLIAKSLRQAGFAVAQHENLDRAGLITALREFGARLNENTIAVVYYAGHGLQLRDHNYLIPVDAEIRSEDEIPIAGLDIGYLLGRMSAARSRVNIVILDACRNNPFSGRSGPRAQGLAQMDAPVGTLLAYATAPGKLAADGSGANSLYASHLAQHMLTPGQPVEQVFKRVREAVVRDTKQLQVPWESSSLQGEFAFVPGVAVAAPPASDVEAAGELAFWNSIQASRRADEYRAYLRQYPNGRFAELARTRVAAYETPPVPAAPPVAPSVAQPAPQAEVKTARADLIPRAGDSWRYRVQDQFRIGDLFVTATIDQVSADGVVERWTTTADDKVRTALAPLTAGYYELPSWSLSPPEFAPYLQAGGALRPGQSLAGQQRRVEDQLVPLQVAVGEEEDVVVAAGRFRAIKLVLKGQAKVRGGALSTEQIIWYAPQVKRTVKSTVTTRLGSAVRESSSFELVEFKLN